MSQPKGDYNMVYRVAFMKESDGSFEVVELFEANSNKEANNYAEENYQNEPWYLLDNNYNNINGGRV